MAVPVHDGDRRAGLDAERSERRRETVHALGERRVRVAQPVGVDDFLRRRPGDAVGENLTDGE